MVKIDVSKLVWTDYDNWHLLKGTNYYGGAFFITEKDIDNFIEYICKDVSMKFDIPYKEATNIISSYNSEFYKLKKELFEFYYSISERNPDYINLVSTFKVPFVSYLERCLDLFSFLSPEEKKLFLSKISFND